ncbi:hypothetical protein MRX96_006131 [Rhipicephalus microplus]
MPWVHAQSRVSLSDTFPPMKCPSLSLGRGPAQTLRVVLSLDLDQLENPAGGGHLRRWPVVAPAGAGADVHDQNPLHWDQRVAWGRGGGFVQPASECLTGDGAGEMDPWSNARQTFCLPDLSLPLLVCHLGVDRSRINSVDSEERVVGGRWWGAPFVPLTRMGPRAEYGRNVSVDEVPLLADFLKLRVWYPDVGGHHTPPERRPKPRGPAPNAEHGRCTPEEIIRRGGRSREEQPTKRR